MPEPVRTCVGCGARAPQRALVRVRLAAGQLEVDRRRAGGRGAWLHADAACLARAEKRRAFGRALRCASVATPPGLLRELLTGSARKD